MVFDLTEVPSPTRNRSKKLWHRAVTDNGKTNFHAAFEWRPSHQARAEVKVAKARWLQRRIEKDTEIQPSWLWFPAVSDWLKPAKVLVWLIMGTSSQQLDLSF